MSGWDGLHSRAVIRAGEVSRKKCVTAGAAVLLCAGSRRGRSAQRDAELRQKLSARAGNVAATRVRDIHLLLDDEPRRRNVPPPPRRQRAHPVRQRAVMLGEGIERLVRRWERI
jgi:hypothetical protein